MEKTQRRIHQLPQEIVRLIAAGEVIERPASVVKELIENSLDAGAAHVEVKLINGGLTSIVVRDDGCGIPADQVPLLLQRHITSKIDTEDDLNEIRTLGFRGEALYSIAAVSDLILSTHYENEETGTRLSFEKEEAKVEPIPWPGGTQVESLSLFHATPARRKFLRASSAEFARVAALVSAYALAYSEIAWTLTHNGRETLRSPGTGNLDDALVAVYGADTARRMIRIEESFGPVAVSGAVSAMDLTRARRTDQAIFLNGRLIRDPSISATLGRAYEPFLPHGRHPIAVLRISCEPSEVDVNVHPHKREVRFSKPREITGAVYRAVRNALAGSYPMEFGRLDEKQEAPGKPVTIDETTGEVLSVGPSVPPSPPSPNEVAEERAWAIREPKHRHTGVLDEQEDKVPTGDGARPTSRRVSNVQHKYPSFEEIGIGEGQESPGHMIQFADTYLIYDNGQSVYLIDQHNLHERILYEEFRKRERSSRGASQTLLFPMQVTLPPSLAELVEAHRDDLTALGFDIEEFSGTGREQAFALRAVPQELKDADPVQAFTDCLERAGESEDLTDPEGFRRAFAINLACKSAIKAGQPLTEEEIRFLIGHIKDGTYYTCPHGRPTIIKLDENWFRRAFKRS